MATRTSSKGQFPAACPWWLQAPRPQHVQERVLESRLPNFPSRDSLVSCYGTATCRIPQTKRANYRPLSSHPHGAPWGPAAPLGWVSGTPAAAFQVTRPQDSPETARRPHCLLAGYPLWCCSSPEPQGITRKHDLDLGAPWLEMPCVFSITHGRRWG